MSRPGPAPGLLGRPAPRAARVLRAPTRRVSTRRNCSDVKSRVPCTLDHTGGPRLSRPGPVPPSTNTPPTAKSTASHPRPGARSTRAAPGAWRPHGPPRWLALTYEDPDIGRGARPARPPAPHAHARLGCWTPRRVPCRGRAAGDVGPYHSPTRTRLAPTVLPPAPSPYHSPTRTHLASTILPPAPTRPRCWLYNGPVREVPAPPSARGVHSLPPHASTPCASRAPRNSPKNLKFFCHRRMPTAYIHVSGFARICAAPNKTRGIRRFGRRVRCVYFFSRPPCAYGGCVVYSWRL